MTSYVVNPSGKVTELLSKFLEFDPEQLKLGIWSGDLSLSNVAIRKDALTPYLSGSGSGSDLHLKLVSGKIGHLRVQIPWKSLVWGQGDVRLQLSDISLIVAHESKEETQKRLRALHHLSNTSFGNYMDQDEIYEPPSANERERKQAWLNDAERRHLHGLKIPPFETHVEEEKKEDIAEESKSTKINKGGMIDSYIKEAMSNITWRFFAGLQASIRNVRVVFVQDGVEVGSILHSLEVKAGKGDTAQTEPESSLNSTTQNSFATPPDDTIDYQGEFEDGEHVDKTILVHGFGIFLRKQYSANVPDQPLRFSLAVGGEDYILRPAMCTFSFSFFYPYPPERQKKKRKPTEATSVTKQQKAVASAGSVVSETSSKRQRRGKRERDVEPPIPMPPTQAAQSQPEVAEQVDYDDAVDHHDDVDGHHDDDSDKAITYVQDLDHLDILRSSSDPLGPKKRHSAAGHKRADTDMSPMATLVETKSKAISDARTISDQMSTALAVQQQTAQQVSSPHLDFKLVFGDLKSVCSRQHLELALTFVATLKRMQNGRPDKSILSVLGNKDEQGARFVMVDAPITPDGNSVAVGNGLENDDAGDKPPSFASIPRPARLSMRSFSETPALSSSMRSITSPNLDLTLIKTPLVRNTTEQLPTTTKRLRLALNFNPTARSEKSTVVRSWWKYAINNALEAVRVKREKQSLFGSSTFHFDWNKQKFMRRQYVNLYIRYHLEKSSVFPSAVDVLLAFRNPEESLLSIEDELPVEQILLYRSIARALRVRGYHEMQESILCLHSGEQYLRRLSMNIGAKTSTMKSPRNEREGALFESARQSFTNLALNEGTVGPVSPTNVAWLRAKFDGFRKRRCEDDDNAVFTKAELGQLLAPQYRQRRTRSFGRSSLFSVDEASRSRQSNNHQSRDRVNFSLPPQTVAADAFKTDDKSFITAKSKRSAEATTMVSTQLRLSFSFKLDKLEFLMFRDGPTVGQLVSESSSVAKVVGSQLLRLPREGVGVPEVNASDDIVSILTDDGDYSKLDPFDPVAIHEEEYPVLSSVDFLDFGKPEGIVLEICVEPVQIVYGGLSGGSKKLTFAVGAAVIRGEDSCDLLYVGGVSPMQAPDSLLSPMNDVIDMAPSLLAKERKISSDKDAREAIKGNLLLIVGKKNFLEIDVGRAVSSAELHAIVGVHDLLVSSSAILPVPLIATTELDRVREAVIARSREARHHDLIINMDYSLRCHGIDVLLPSPWSKNASESSSLWSGSQRIDPRKRIRVSLPFVEYYTASLVRQMSDFLSPKSNLVSELIEESGELLSAQESIFRISAIDLTIDVPSTSQNGYIESFPLLDRTIDVELFLNPTQGWERRSYEMTMSVSAVHLIVSESRISALYEIMIASDNRKLSSDTGRHATPRLEALSGDLLLAVDLAMESLSLSVIGDGDNLLIEYNEMASITVEKEPPLRECIADYLNYVADCDIQNPVKEALEVAQSVCIQRLIGLGLEQSVALECTENALLQFLGGHNVEDSCVEFPVDSFQKNAAAEGLQKSQDDSGVALETALERTVKSFLPLISTSSSRNLLRIEAASGVDLTFSKFVYDSHLAVEVHSLSVASSCGMKVIGLNGYNDVEDADESNRMPRRALCLSLFHTDKGYGFASGGSPLSVLRTDDKEEPTRRERENLIDIGIGSLDFTFCSTEIIEMLQVTDLVRRKSRSMNHDAIEGKSTVGTTVSVNLEEANLVLLDEGFRPFSKCYFSDIWFGNRATSLITSAKQVSLLNLAVQGQHYPAILKVLDETANIPGSSAFRLRFLPSPSPWKQSPTLDVELDGVQLLFLRRYTRELTQFMLSKDYGLGRLLSQWESVHVVDDYGNPPPPLQYKLLVSQSSLIIPRSSTDSDMLAVEFDSLVVFNSFHNYSFELPSENKALNKGQARSFNKSPSGFSASSHFDDRGGTEFFDCVDTPRSSPTSIFHRNLIRRINVKIEGANIFTSLPAFKAKRTPEPELKFLRQHGLNGRAQPGKFVFQHLPTGFGMLGTHDLLSRSWECITKASTSLEVLVDYAPHMRVLITDDLDYETISSLVLGAKMSQLYLVLSVWYVNMQEMPEMFPVSGAVNKTETGTTREFTVPEYGTEAFVELLLGNQGENESEIVCQFHSMSLHCAFDESGYFETDPASLQLLPEKGPYTAISLSLENWVLHVAIDRHGVLRVGTGSEVFQIVDHRKSDPFSGLFFVDHISRQVGEESTHAWADMTFGLDLSGRTLAEEKFPLSFQASVFMVPGWVLVNMGSEGANATMIDFSPISILLDYFSCYFTDPCFGYPLLETLASRADQAAGDSQGLNIDFRLWLLRPFLCIPSELSMDSPSLRIESKYGFWYQLKSFGLYTSQEMGSPSMSLRLGNNFQRPSLARDPAKRSRATSLIDGFSFGLRIDSNTNTSHNEYAFCTPMWDFVHERPVDRCRVTSKELSIPQLKLEEPAVCTPIKSLDREHGLSVSEITLLIEALPVTVTMMMHLLGLNNESDPSQPDRLDGAVKNGVLDDPSIVLNARIEGLRFFLVDPILGIHRPYASFSLSSMHISVSRLSENINSQNCLPHESLPSDLQVAIETKFWADYFKVGLTRSWEPLLEPFMCFVMYEKSMRRGKGLTLTSDIPFHVNLTGSFLVPFSDAVESLARSWLDAFGSSKPSSTLGADEKTLETAVALLNMTGSDIRTVQVSLKHGQSTNLNFPSTMSQIQNMKFVETPFPGLRDSPRDSSYDNEVDKESSSVVVDILIPGFQWLQGLSVDRLGRKFDDIFPVSSAVRNKLSSDWRLENTMKLLTEIGLDRGGRLITLRSLFEIRNHTTHKIQLSAHPDPTHKPSLPLALLDTSSPSALSTDDRGTADWLALSPGDTFQVPYLLLESALRLDGRHLGSVWFRPEKVTESRAIIDSFLNEQHDTASHLSIGFSSRPVQLAKVVHESALLFQAADGEDLPPDKVLSGIQVSCPIVDNSDGSPLAPFCYVVEIRRSPLVQSQMHSTNKKEFRHSPVAYTLTIHPPLVIENLLPVRGRFELMHATRRVVVWYGDLNPGQKVPVHNVGLDAPLLLLVNLGYCRTPVGEGALVHHGPDEKGSMVQQGGFKSFGKAVTKGTKQIGKTLTSISDSPDQRGKGRLFLVQNPQYAKGTPKNKTLKGRPTIVAAGSLGLDADLAVTETGRASGQIHLVDNRVYTTEELATETVVVDSVGQKLILKIENVRGGGGHRRVSLFCPYWIVNTTAHPLRYKQEKSSMFVSGTVLSPSSDGSKAVGGYTREAPKTVFSGTPGALARFRRSAAQEELVELLENELEIETLSSLGFMFNFQEESILLGQQKLCVQLADGFGNLPYTSDWSQGFSLETAGVPQLVGMHCKDGRALELSVTVNVAPGSLSGYTKIVRFSPRYAVVNRLNRPIRLWQDSSLLHSIFVDQGGTTVKREAEKWQLVAPSANHLQTNGNMDLYDTLFGNPAAVEETLRNGTALGTTASKSAFYIATVEQGELVPFHLPDTRGDRQFRIDLGGQWTLSSSFDADVTGEYTMKLRKAWDLRLLPHVNTRASPHYRVNLPPAEVSEWDGELGVWFETAWGGDRKILVKGTKRGKYAFNNTDVRVGDELLQVDEIPVSRLTFAETMKLLKERLANISVVNRAPSSMRGRRASSLRPRRSKMSRSINSSNFKDPFDEELGTPRLVLTFRTLEERLRRVRARELRRAAPTQGTIGVSLTKMDSNMQIDDDLENMEGRESDEHKVIKVDMRAIYSSLFLVVREQSPETVPYRIENTAMNHVIYFRQKGCEEYPWNILQPGEKTTYSWEEPMRSHKLTLRVGSAQDHIETGSDREDDGSFEFPVGEEIFGAVIDKRETQKRRTRIKHALSYPYVDGEDKAGLGNAVTVKLEELGFQCEATSPIEGSGHGHTTSLNCRVDSDGATRVLVISNTQMSKEESIRVLGRYIQQEEERRMSLIGLARPLEVGESSHIVTEEESVVEPDHSKQMKTLRSAMRVDPSQIEEEAVEIADFPGDTIHRRNQLLVEVCEASGLQPPSVVGLCNPFCEVVLNGRVKRGSSLFRSSSTLRRTYYLEKTVSPKWINQSFVFDILPEAVTDQIRDWSVQIRVRSFRLLGQGHPLLGQTTVRLRSLRNQQEVTGWYPLVGRTGVQELEGSRANWGRGSIKLRVQWIHTVSALVNYFLLVSEKRLVDLQARLDRASLLCKDAVEVTKQPSYEKSKVVSTETCQDFILQKIINGTGAATESMKFRLEARAAILYESRNGFEKACRRSLRAVVNPGGWLSVCPITVLNFPDSYAGMSVKIRYGAVSLVTESVDARVTPVWTNQELSIPIDPQRTSGSIRLSVVAERMKTKVELGVLEIPLGAAINCCLNCIENTSEHTTAEIPMYIRWFPLMNPRETVPVDGDMGFSGRPLDTEEETETIFSRQVLPCIKLALIWRPRDAETDVDFHEVASSHLNSDRVNEKTYFNADLARISSALIDSQRALELLAISASDVDVRYSESSRKTRVGFVVGSFQVDQQVPGTQEGVVLAPTPVSLVPEPTLQFLSLKDNLRSKGKIDSFELIAFYMEELDVTMEEKWIYDVWEFIVGIIRRKEVTKRAHQNQNSRIMREKQELLKSSRFSPRGKVLEETSLLEALWEDDTSEAKTYIEKLYLGPIRINVSYFKGKRSINSRETGDFGALLDEFLAVPEILLHSTTQVQDPRFSETFSKWSNFTHDEDLWTESGEGKSSVNLPNVIAGVLPSISEAPIRLQGKGITFIFEDRNEIFNSLKNYYVNEFLRQLYKILGSLEFVGNPTMFLNSLATGVRDFFVVPSREFLRSPHKPGRVGVGVAKGTLSLFSHSASGFFALAAKMMASAGQLAANLSLDPEYQAWHHDVILSEAQNLDRRWKRKGAGEVSLMIARPLVDILRGVALAATGIITMPVMETRKYGAKGFIGGTLKGGVGVLIKPVVGICDALSHFMGAIHGIAKSVNILEKRYTPARKLRLPYTFGLGNVLVPFNPATARSVLLLKKFPVSRNIVPDEHVSKVIASSEVHVASEILVMEPGVETIIVVTTVRVVLIKVKRDNSGMPVASLGWEVSLVTRASISSRLHDVGHNGVSLTVCATIHAGNAIAGDQNVRNSSPGKLGLSESLKVQFKDDVGAVMTPSVDNEDAEIENAISAPRDGWILMRRRVHERTGDVVEYFSVMAEFQHRLQLSRLHNAICCLTGNMGAIIRDKGLNKDGTTEGYTSFGEFHFISDDTGAGKSSKTAQRFLAEENKDNFGKGFSFATGGEEKSEESNFEDEWNVQSGRHDSTIQGSLLSKEFTIPEEEDENFMFKLEGSKTNDAQRESGLDSIDMFISALSMPEASFRSPMAVQTTGKPDEAPDLSEDEDGMTGYEVITNASSSSAVTTPASTPAAISTYESTSTNVSRVEVEGSKDSAPEEVGDNAIFEVLEGGSEEKKEAEIHGKGTSGFQPPLREEPLHGEPATTSDERDDAVNAAAAAKMDRLESMLQRILDISVSNAHEIESLKRVLAVQPLERAVDEAAVEEEITAVMPASAGKTIPEETLKVDATADDDIVFLDSIEDEEDPTGIQGHEEIEEAGDIVPFCVEDDTVGVEEQETYEEPGEQANDKEEETEKQEDEHQEETDGQQSNKKKQEPESESQGEISASNNEKKDTDVAC